MATEPLHGFKICRKCGVGKPATTEFFHKKLGGLTPMCRPCRNASKRAEWAAKAEELNAARRAARDDETRRVERERYARNPYRKRENVTRWRKANPEKKRESDRLQYKKFADKKKRQAAEWAAKNPERKRHNVREFYRRKRATDPAYRLRSSVSAYVYWCLSSRKEGRRTEDLLGYTIAALRSHLERQFLPGMAWENYGEWHVDHILPVASFTFEAADDPEFKACWALTNLRPMWAADNIRKSDKRLFLI